MAFGALAVASLCAGAAARSPSTAGASNATLAPTTTADVVDPDDGQLSLREAMRAADETPGPDVIQLVAGAEYALDQPCAPIQEGDGANLLDDLDHRGGDDLTIVGDHAQFPGTTIRQALDDPTCWQARVLDVGTGTLTLVGVRLTGGHVDDPCIDYATVGTGPVLCAQALGPDRGDGGAVRAAGAVVLDHAGIVDNRATDTLGGGVWSAVSIAATDSYVGRNTAKIGGGLATGGDVTLERSSVNDNRAIGRTHVVSPEEGAGGGVWAGGDVVVANSTVSGNRVPGRPPVPPGEPVQRLHGFGGGILADDRLTLVHATVAGNLADTGSNLEVENFGVTAFGSAIGESKPGVRPCAIHGPVVSSGYNVVRGSRCRLGDGPGDLVHQGPLGLNPPTGLGRRPGGGHLSIIPPSACTLRTVDQNRRPRPQGSFCEAGSVEVPYP